MGRKLTAFGVSAALAIGTGGCGEQHQASPDKPADASSPRGKTLQSGENPNVGRLAANPRIVRRLLQKPTAEIYQKLRDSKGATSEADMPKFIIRTGVCAIVGYKKGGRTVAHYIREPAAVYRNDKGRGLGETVMAGIDPMTGKMIMGQPRIVDQNTGQVREVEGKVREIDIYQDSRPNLESQPVELSTTAGGDMVHNSRGEEVMTVTGASVTHESLGQLANDPLVQYACFAGYGSVPPPTGARPVHPSPSI